MGDVITRDIFTEKPMSGRYCSSKSMWVKEMIGHEKSFVFAIVDRLPDRPIFSEQSAVLCRVVSPVC
jgi:hypothetical protein